MNDIYSQLFYPESFEKIHTYMAGLLTYALFESLPIPSDSYRNRDSD